MGCFLTTTEKDLKQMKQRLSGHNHKSTVSVEEQFQRTVATLATYLPSALPVYLKYTAGRTSYEMGKLGETVAEKVLEQSMNLKIVERTKAQGVDLKATGKGGTSVTIEVKTSVQKKSFRSLLGTGYGHKQCSDGWLKAVGVDPSKTEILGIHINPETERVTVYRRDDSSATSWTPIIKDAPLSKFNF